MDIDLVKSVQSYTLQDKELDNMGYMSITKDDEGKTTKVAIELKDITLGELTNVLDFISDNGSYDSEAVILVLN